MIDPGLAERELVSAALWRAAVTAECEGITGAHFSDLTLGIIFDAARDAWNAGVEHECVVEVAEATRISPAEVLAVHGQATFTQGDEAIARRVGSVLEAHRRRTLARLGADLNADMRSGATSEEGALRCERVLDEIRGGSKVKPLRTVATSTVMEDYLSEGEETGPRFWLSKVDSRVAPMQPGQVVIVAARPSIGKSALAAHVCLLNAERGVPVLFLSLEMGEKELHRRFVANLAGVPVAAFGHKGRRKLTDVQVADACAAEARMASLPIAVDDTEEPSLSDVRYLFKRARRWQKVGLVVIDYLGLLRAEKASSRQEEVAGLSRGVKLLAKGLEVPVLLLAQINRGVESRTGEEKGRPKLADLRDSGQIEADADVVIGLYRDEFYNEKTPEPGVMEVDVLKQRNGPIGLCKVRCDMATGRLSDLDSWEVSG